MTKTEEYLYNLLNKFNQYEVSLSDRKIIDRDLIGFIFQKISIKKFRKQKLFPETIDDIKNKIKFCISNSKPIKFTLLFGGYKHFWNKSAPEIDWAEVFSLKFLIEWLAPISSVYKPGVVLELVSEDWVLERMDNYSQESLDKYSNSLCNLIDIFNVNLPDNLRINYIRLSDIFDKSEMMKAIDERMDDGYKRWNSLSQDEKDIELRRSRRSVMLGDNESDDKLIESRVTELAYYESEALPQFLNNYSDEDKIYFCMSFGLSNDNIDHWLTLGSTYASTVDFWVGRGIIEERDDSFIRRIVSREQYDRIKNNLKLEQIENIEPALSNLQTIEIISSIDWDKIINN